MSSSSSYYRGKNEAKKGVNNTLKLMYIPMDCRCGMRAEIKIVEVNPDTMGELYYSCCESGLGRDPDTGAITASDERWELKLMRHPDCHKFRVKPLALEDEMRILFGSNTATGEGSYAPNSGVMPRTRERPPVVDVDDIDELLDDDATQELVHPTKVQKQGLLKALRAVAENPTMKECANKLSELREFNEDAELWAQAFNLFKDSKI
ncbi:hypothetical protein RHMOL_Rhmol07G0216000 [Rhododendron molle]|uniref:Uncharacterized protein n=1 Tax=Rhododendron molle TaxID=49168 RepID=A0ACC0N4W0_RHOML|nr:hypothetical protein RHMOL_Rhmol07G0216000 [Rhododendron molle]